MIAYVSIGNSDDKLTQAEWSEYVGKTQAVIANAVSSFDGRIHGEWFSRPDAPWQNACWCVELDMPAEHYLVRLKRAFAEVAGIYRQDSIAWAEAPVTEFLAPAVTA